MLGKLNLFLNDVSLSSTMIVSLIVFRYHVQCAVSHATLELAKYHAKASLFAVFIAFSAKMGTTQTVVVSDFQLNL